jgi:hypothetical protein
MSNEPAQSRELVAEAVKHPLFVLLVGTLLGSIAIPQVNRSIEADRRLATTRVEYAQKALQSARDVDRKLNVISTLLDNFRKDQVNPQTLTNESISQLRTQLYKLYEDFDREAWWWHWQALEDSDLLGLLTADTRQDFADAAEAYQRNLVAATQALDPLWRLTVDRRTPDVSGMNLAADEMLARLRELANERQQVVRQMVRAVLGS